MRYIILTVLSILIIYSYLNEKDPFIATASFDGLGHYLLTNYQIDSKNCVNFVDYVGKYKHFCGSYKIVPKEHYVKEYIESLPYKR